MSASRVLPSPYQGLVPYAEEDAAYFFGRERERDIVVANLMASRLTILYGPSGVGKTSLLQAGVVHHVHSMVRANIAERGSPELAVVFFSSWRDDPVEGLASAIRAATAHPPRLPTDPAAKRRLRDRLSTLSPAGTVYELQGYPQIDEKGQPTRYPDVLGELPRAHLSRQPIDRAIEDTTTEVDGELLIVLDQFEEFFLYHDEQGDRTGFVAELSRAINRWDLRASFLVSIREDALAKLDRFKGMVPNLFDNYLRIEHLGVEAARMAIEGPVDQYNRDLDPGSPAFRLEPGLADEVLRQVRAGAMSRDLGGAGTTSPGTDIRVEAPYLQLVMSRLWDEESHAASHLLGLDGLMMSRLWDEESQAASHLLRLDTLTRLGGAKRIVLTHLDDAMSNLLPDEQDAAAKMFRYLVTPSGSKIAHTPSDLAAYTEMSEAALLPALEKLCRWQTRILRPVASAPGQPDVVRYEIFHDVLAPAIQDWRVRHLQTRELERVERIARTRRRWMLRLGIPLILLLIAATTASLLTSRRRNTFGLLTGHTNTVRSVSFSPNGSILASGSYDRTVRLWDLGHPDAAPVMLRGKDIISSVAFSPNGRTLASGGGDGTVRLWDTGNSDATPVVPGNHLGPILSVAFSPDGRTLASGGFDGSIRLWDPGHPDAARVLRGHEGTVVSIAFSPDGGTLASGSSDQTIRLWDLSHPNAAPVVLEDHEGPVYSVAFSPDGRTLASGGGDRKVRLWDLEHPDATPVVLGTHEATVSSVAFSPDGRTLASGGFDATVRLWARGEPVPTVLRSRGGSIYSVAFSPDGALIATGDENGTVEIRVLPTRPNRPLPSP